MMSDADQVTDSIRASEPEYRFDAISRRWSIVAPARSLRPLELSASPTHDRIEEQGEACPFCPGREYDTPHEVYAVRKPDSLADGLGWELRVVPNKFPAVELCALADATVTAAGNACHPAHGRHEVVIECREHIANPSLLSEVQLLQMLRAYRQRLIAFAEDRSLAYAAVFQKCRGSGGGFAGAQPLADPGHGHRTRNHPNRIGQCQMPFRTRGRMYFLRAHPQ